MLQVNQLHQYYGGSHILRGVDFAARQGEITCLLGRNGVGKTTLLKCLMGLIPARSGEVLWQEKNITHRKPHQRVQSGIAYVPQGREIFPRLTVEENLVERILILVPERHAVLHVIRGNKLLFVAQPGAVWP